MKRRLIATCLVPFAAACVPQGLSEQDMTNFDQAIVSIGCDLKFESDYQPMEFQTGLSREDLQRIAAAKAQRGEVVALEGGGVRSQAGTCAPKPAS